MIHKYLAGLIDQYQLAGDGQALEVAAGLADWVDWRTSRLLYARMPMVLENEYGALPEALANLYAITGTKRYLAAAQRFYHARVLDPLAAGEDVLPGLQCNVTVPKIISCVRLWEETGNRKYRDIAQNFWRLVTGHYTYVIGGSGNYEHWHAPDVDAGQLSNRTCEGCVTYHLFKLTRLLHFHDQERTDLLDYYERALFNQMLGTQDPDSPHGFNLYYTGLSPGAFKQQPANYSPTATRTCTPPTTPISPATTRPEWSRRRSSPTRSTPVTPAAALRYRASSSGAPARNWITAPSGADRAASAIRTSAARASWFSCAGVNAAGTGMSCPASSSRAWACRSSPPAGRAVSASQNCGHMVASTSTSTGARPRSRSNSRARRRPAHPARPQPGRDRTGPRSATPRSAAQCPAGRAARPRAGSGRSDAIAAKARVGPAAGAALPSRPGSCRWRTRRPGPRSGCGPARPP